MRSNITIKNYYKNSNCKSNRATSGCAVISPLQTIAENPTAKWQKYFLMRSNTIIKNYYRNPNCKNDSATIGCAVILPLKPITEIPTLQ